MLVYGFTGTQSVSQAQAMAVRHVLLRLEDPDLVVTGGCVGVDSIVGSWYAEFTEADQRLVLPYNLRKVQHWYKHHPHVEVERMPAGTSYMDRNDRMASILADYAQQQKRGQVLHRVRTFAFPHETAEQRRSGTWATVRRFRGVGLPPQMYPLDSL